MTEETIKLNREDLKNLKEKGYITRDHFADVNKTKRWKPKKGESYWYVSDAGRCVLTTSNRSELDEERFEFRNVYQTDDEAQKELDRRLAEQELLDMCDGSSDDDYWVEIEYDRDTDLFETGQHGSMVGNCYHFASGKSAQKAIDTLGTDKLKLIFRIGD